METFRSAFSQRCTELGVEPPAYIMDKLSESKTEKLELSGHSMNQKILTALCTSLQNDVYFTALSLADSFLGDDGAILISGCLKNNTSITTIDLRGNNIRSDGATALSQMLKVNHTLKNLLLEWNCIGIWDNGVRSLSDALSVNQTLELLDLRNCKIGPQGAQALALGLKHNTCLKRLDLRWNNIGMTGGRSLLDCLKWNTVLTDIDIVGNEIPEDLARAISTALERNKDRQKSVLTSKYHSEHLSSTLQTLTTSHQTAIEQLASKLTYSDAKSNEFAERLQATVKENHTLQNSLRAAESRIENLQLDLNKERKESQRQVTELQKELVTEREKRMRAEDYSAKATSNLTLKATELEASLRETEMKAEVLRRDKVLLLEELDKAKTREKEIKELHHEKLQRLDSTYQARVLAAQESKDNEMAEKARRYEERLRAVEHEKALVEETLDSTKSKHSVERRSLIDKISETEIRMRKEEESHRLDWEKQMLALRESRDKLTAELQSQSTLHKALINDHENELKRMISQRVSLTDQIEELKTAQLKYTSEISHLKTALDEQKRGKRDADEKLVELTTEIAKLKEEITKERGHYKVELEKALSSSGQKDIKIARLKDEIRRLEDDLTEEREDQSIRMKDLTNQINTLLTQRKRHVRSRSIEQALAQ